MKACVVGAGVVGLTTALELQKQFRDINVTVLADKFNTETTSDGAAGLFMPYLNFQGSDEHLTNKWLQDAFLFYQELLGENCGVVPVSGYHLSYEDGDDFHATAGRMQSISPKFRPATPVELKHLATSFKSSRYCPTVVVANRKFLPWCIEKLERNGVRIRHQTISDFSPLSDQYDAVFNCTGLASRYLCSDTNVIPVRGQIVQVLAPWIKRYYFFNNGMNYIIPCGYDGFVTLGGTQDYDSYDTSVVRETAESIVSECSKLLPNLRYVPRIRDWVGLRPYRKETRVELEKRNKSVLIHNYGHGGCGVTTAPGTSKYAVELLQNFQCSGTVVSKL